MTSDEKAPASDLVMFSIERDNARSLQLLAEREEARRLERLARAEEGAPVQGDLFDGWPDQ